MGFFNETYDNLDTGVLDSVTLGADLRYVSKLFIEVKEKTGDTDACILTVQCSVDNVNWNDSSTTLTFNSGFIMINDLAAIYRYARLKVTTKSTIASTADACIQGK